MKFDKLKVGMTIYDCHSCKMGNTTMRTLGVWPVNISEIDDEKRRALVSWNGYRAVWRCEDFFAKLTEKRPVLIRTQMGLRRPTREELAEIRAKVKAETTQK